MGFKETDNPILAGLFGQALYDVIYPKWWGGQGKLSEEPITAKVNEQMYRRGSNPAGELAAPQWQSNYGDSLEVTVAKGPRPKEKVDVTKMIPAGMHSSYRPRTGGPRKRGDPYNLDDSGHFLGAGRAINLNLGNDQFIPGYVEPGTASYLQHGVNFPIFNEPENAKSRIKDIIREDKKARLYVDKEREGFSDDDERENSRGEINNDTFRPNASKTSKATGGIPGSRLMGSITGGRFLEDENNGRLNRQDQLRQRAAVESHVPVTTDGEGVNTKNRKIIKKDTGQKAAESHSSGASEDDFEAGVVVQPQNRRATRTAAPGRPIVKSPAGLKSDDELLTSQNEDLKGFDLNEENAGLGKNKRQTKDKTLQGGLMAEGLDRFAQGASQPGPYERANQAGNRQGGSQQRLYDRDPQRGSRQDFYEDEIQGSGQLRAYDRHGQGGSRQGQGGNRPGQQVNDRSFDRDGSDGYPEPPRLQNLDNIDDIKMNDLFDSKRKDSDRHNLKPQTSTGIRNQPSNISRKQPVEGLPRPKSPVAWSLQGSRGKGEGSAGGQTNSKQGEAGAYYNYTGNQGSKTAEKDSLDDLPVLKGNQSNLPKSDFRTSTRPVEGTMSSQGLFSTEKRHRASEKLDADNYSGNSKDLRNSPKFGQQSAEEQSRKLSLIKGEDRRIIRISKAPASLR